MKIDQLIRSSRKTIALIVRRDGQLVVRAPHKATNAQIFQFIEQKADWIRSKQEQARERKTQTTQRQYVSGETFLYLGEAYPLDIIERGRNLLNLKDGRFLMAQHALPQAQAAFMTWYKQQAYTVLEERTQLYAARYNIAYQQLRISSARTRWGSCSAKNTLSFTWRLVMALLPVIDYVVVHELAHVLEKNHSKKFWDQVAAMMPDYAQRMRWLKQNGYQLTLE